MANKVVPNISNINIDHIDTVAPHYVWLDEDDAQVSQICKHFRAAMDFINGWQERWDKQVDRNISFSNSEARDFKSEYSPWRKLTRSGKPPAKLKRIEVEISVVDCTDEEQAKANIMMGA